MIYSVLIQFQSHIFRSTEQRTDAKNSPWAVMLQTKQDLKFLPVIDLRSWFIGI
jgi:hypothetical protein